MSERINTILILGAAGGIGEALARRFHAIGKKVIATGRKSDRPLLDRLSQDLSGVDVRTWDLTELEQMQQQVHNVLGDYPELDSVYVNAGIQSHYNMFEQLHSQEQVIRELTTNLTAPILISHLFAQHLLKLAQSGTRTNLFLTSSSLAYFPVPFYPVYCPCKAGVASFAKVLRFQLEHTGCKNMNIVEVVPPYVDTPLNEAHREQTDALQGGKDKAVQPMPLEKYIDAFFTELERTKTTGSLRDEIGVGFGAQSAAIWHEGFEKLRTSSGMSE